MQICEHCHEPVQVIHNVGTPAQPAYWCYLCVITARGPVCIRCGGAHDYADCDVPEGFRQLGEAQPD